MEKIRVNVIPFKLLMVTLWMVSCILPLSSQAPYRCTATKLNIRDSADKSGKVIGQITQDETVDILSVKGGWGSVLIGDDTGFVSMDYVEPVQTTSPQSQSAEKPWTDKQQAIFWLCFIVAVGIYIFAVVKVRQGEMVVIRGWLDFGLLAFPWLALFAQLYDAFWGGLFLGEYVRIALFVIGGLCLLGSLALSVIANWGSPFYIIFSLIMKLIVIPIMAFGVFYLIYKLMDKTGLTRRSIIIFLVLGFLIGGLMSFEE